LSFDGLFGFGNSFGYFFQNLGEFFPKLQVTLQLIDSVCLCLFTCPLSLNIQYLNITGLRRFIQNSKMVLWQSLLIWLQHSTVYLEGFEQS